MSIIKSCRTTKGFTLMEILFVLLLIALIVSFAMPAFRSVRHDIRNSRARAALKKLAEARRSYYQVSRGSQIRPKLFSGNSISAATASGTCNNPAASGVPASATTSTYDQLFACGFLNWKDFAGLPYTFVICAPNGGTSSWYCHPNGEVASVVALGEPDSGKYVSNSSNKYCMYVADDMQVKDTAN